MNLSNTFNLLILIFCLNNSLAQNTEIIRKIDEIISTPINSGQVAGIAVTVIQNDKILYDNNFGSADIERDIPLTARSQFQIGSITKIFTATAIYKLYELGKINLNSPVSSYLPEFISREYDPAIKDLLTHTSGIPEYTMNVDAESGNMRSTILQTIQNTPYNFNPRSQVSYSNSGYYLLGLIIEKVSNMSYGDFIFSELVEPYNFKNISYYQSDDHVERSKGYIKPNAADFVERDNIDPSYPYAAGSITTNSSDLAKWFNMLNNGDILKPYTFEKMKDIATLQCGHETWYGSGLFMNADPSGRHVIRHSGDHPAGFRSDLCYYSESDLTIAVLVNTQSSSRPEKIVLQIADEITKLSRPVMSAATNESALTGIYYGYLEGRERIMEVLNENDTLKVSDNGDQGQTLYKIGGNKFTTGPNKWAEVPEYEFIVKDNIRELHYTGISTHGVLTDKISPEIKYWRVGSAKTSIVKVDGKDVRIRTKAPFTKRFPNQPMVIMETGYGVSLDYWGNFFTRIGDFIPVMAYDRAGLGKSEWINRVPTDEFKVKRLKKLLETINAEPPYVLVGHSYGCDLVRLFAEQYPKLAAGLVLLDPVSENPNEVLKAFETIGGGREQYDDLISYIFKDSDNLWAMAHAKLDKPKWEKALPYNRAKPDHIPIKILFAGQKPTQSMAEQLPFDVYSHQKELNKLALQRISSWIYQVPEGEMIIIPSSGHLVFNDEPEIAIEAIKDIIYPDIHRAILHLLEDKGIEATIKNYYLRKGYYPVNYFYEDLLNQLGYKLLRFEKYDEAIAIFELNTKEYPNEANPYDSLGDAYRKAGELRKAVASYEKAALLADKNRDPRAENYRKRFEYYKSKL